MSKFVFSPGQVYFDQKSGVRRIEKIVNDPISGEVITYTTLAAKQTVEYDWRTKGMVNLIGQENTCKRASFQSWAKTLIPPQEVDKVLASLQAGKIKLTVNERSAFIEAIKATLSTPVSVGSVLSLTGRYRTSLANKGVITSEGVLTQIGWALYQKQMAP